MSSMFETETVGPSLLLKLKWGVCPPDLPSGYAPDLVSN